MKITREQEEIYVKNRGMHCPICGSPNITARDIEADVDLLQECRCRGCGAEWTDVYKLAGILEAE